MGNVTAKTSGEIASFMTPAKTNIKSLKVHFSPKQLGTGDPSPENVREIEGWDGVEVNGSGKNIAHIVGYSASSVDITQTRKISNKYGTTLSTVDFTLPDTKLVVTQDKYPNTDTKTSYQNGYFQIMIDNLVFNKKYNISFKIDNITNNPLNATLNSIYLGKPNGSQIYPSEVDGNRLIFKNILYSQLTGYPLRQYFEIRNCGMSFTLSEFMVTPVDEKDFEYEPYQGNNISYQWKLPDEYQEVEYIESTGTQWINTGVIGRPNIKVETNFELTDSTNISNCGFIGSREDSGQTRFYIISFYQNKWHLGLQSDINSSIYPVFGSQIQNVIFQNIDGNYSLTVDGANIYSGNSTFSTTYPMYLFGVNNYGTASRLSSFKLYTLKIQQDGNYIRNFIPCYRKLDNEIGLYDLLSQTFYTNQGTGTFIKGNDVDKTFYGGYVDLINGELVEEWEMFTVNEPDTTWRVMAYNRITINFPRKYIFGSRLLKDKSMCTILPENHTNWNYGYIDNVASITNPHALSLNYTGNGEGWSELFGEEATNKNVKSHLQELGFAICATLVEPITHQLTPIQLKSFVGQNNFWSNADYVEVEYDLIETEDIQKARKRIILNQPHIETATNKIASFNPNMIAPLKNCKVYFNPIQLGSGNPSPTNVRDINGWTGVETYVNGNKVSVDWTNDVGTVYGGYVDLVKGEVVAEYFGFVADGENIKTNSGYVNNTSYGAGIVYVDRYGFPDGDRLSVNTYCNTLNPIRSTSQNCVYWTTNGSFYLVFYPFSKTAEDSKTSSEAVEETNEWLKQHPTQIIYKLRTPIHYPLSSFSQQLLTLKTSNHIWSNTNGQQIEAKYWTHKSSTPTQITNYLDGVTWTDNGYISATGKESTSATSASHYTTNAILLEAGTYALTGFSYYVGTDATRFRIHKYNSSNKWQSQITFEEIGNLSPVDISFTLTEDTYVKLSIAMDFDGILAKIN